jgi:predicted RNase H-like HicB family nuclease
MIRWVQKGIVGPAGSGIESNQEPSVDLPIKALIRKEPGGGYSAIVPGFPGCITEGDTIAELRTNLLEAIELWVEVTQEVALREPREQAGDVITL